IRHGGRVTWLGLQQHDDRSATPVPLGGDLYDGLPGVALFLSELAKKTGERNYRELAEGAIRTLLWQIDEGAPLSIGGFSGWGGTAYALGRLGRDWARDDLVGRATGLAERIGAGAELDETLDVIAGSAGAIGGLLAIHRLAPSDALIAAARRCGDRLLATATPQEKGRGWSMASLGAKPLTGFSHGAAGMAWALLQLAGATGEAKYRELALDALTYERSQFAPEEGNWPDHRHDTKAAEGGSLAWCHGAPGIGLGRAASRRWIDDGATRAEIEVALDTTLEAPLYEGQSLCHGAIGNLDCALVMAEALGDVRRKAQIRSKGLETLDFGRQHGWRLGTMGGLEVPGLLIGLAGIGYGLLRLADPVGTPSVLSMDVAD
ncbi:MAG TPA: type 2 lanthipeptide synthetase LanM, partial [Planctomycetia bacterium]|nr:type 2 lanthipeptide synthetase LanM [Planctomycetia bacterium]